MALTTVAGFLRRSERNLKAPTRKLACDHAAYVQNRGYEARRLVLKTASSGISRLPLVEWAYLATDDHQLARSVVAQPAEAPLQFGIRGD